MALTKLKKSQYMIFLDIAKDLTMQACDWKRITKSTVFELSMNPQSETYDWIDQDIPEEVVENNQPEMGQEVAMYEGDPLFDFIHDLFISCPTGEAVKVPYLNCFGGSAKKAWRGIATILFDTLNSVDGKITFTIKINTVEKGVYDVVEGVPTFTEEGAENGEGAGEVAQG